MCHLATQRWPPAVGRRGAGQTTGRWLTSQASLAAPWPSALRLSFPPMGLVTKTIKTNLLLNLVRLMKADPSFPDWGGQSASSPTTGGGRAAIQSRMKSVAHRLANWPVDAHVRGAHVFSNLGSPTHLLFHVKTFFSS